MAPFELVWRGIGAFPSPKHPRALWLGVINGAGPLARGRGRGLAAARGANAVELDDRAFLPHLTLGRVKMAGVGVDWPKILQAVEVKRITSVVDRVTLYRSQLSQQGPHYTGLVCAPLIKTSRP